MRRWAGVLALWVLVALPCAAQTEAKPSPPRPVTVKPQEVNIPRVSRAPKIEDFEGMTPGGVAGEMLHLDTFTQQFPHDGQKGTQRTEAFLGYDNTNLYIVFLCFDNKHATRANLD